MSGPHTTRTAGSPSPMCLSGQVYAMTKNDPRPSSKATSGPRCTMNQTPMAMPDQAGQRGVEDALPHRDQSALQGLRAVLGAEGVVAVGAGPVVGEVVEEIVGGVRRQQADREQEKRDRVEEFCLPGEDPGDGRRDERHHQHCSPAGNEPPAHRVESLPLGTVNPGNPYHRLTPHAGGHLRGESMAGTTQ